MKFRNIAIGMAVLGIIVGVAFGAGVAMGKGNPKTVQTGLSAAQIQQLYGASTAGGAGNAAGGTGRTGNAAAGASGATGSPAETANVNLGRITAVDGSSVTIETAQGATKLNLSPATKVTKMTDGSTSDLQTGILVSYSGTRKDDGSVDVTSVSNVPAELQGLANRGGGTRQGAATPTP